MKLSAIIIVKNEDERIARCLESLTFCDEIIIINNASVDRTAEIVKKFTSKIFETDTHDFSKLRTIGLEKAKGDFVLYVDADEVVSEELASSVHLVLSGGQKKAAYRIKRKNFYLGNNEWPKIEHPERLFNKKNLKGWYGELHESPKVDGEIGELDGFLLHYTHRSLSEMVTKTIEWSKIEAELRFKAHHPKMSLWRFPRVMIGEFFNWYIKQGGWRIGTVGLIESMYQSFSIFITYARLWELQQKKDG